MKASYLFEQGKEWSAHVWIKGNYEIRDQIIAKMNTKLDGTKIRIGHGWHNYDPIVRVGRPRNYASIAADLDTDAKHNASLFNAFAFEEYELEDLSAALQELCVIVFFAEVGRGYSSSLTAQLYPLIQDIQKGKESWTSIKKRYTPSLTYREDDKVYILE